MKSVDIVHELYEFYVDSGVEALVPLDVLEAGLGDIVAEFAPVAGELLKAEHHGISLASAVYDDEGYPNLVRLHGLCADLLDIELPTEFADFANRMKSVALSDPERVSRLNGSIASVALCPQDNSGRLVGRLVLFEILCLTERITLHEQSRTAHLSRWDSPGNAVEVAAEQELQHVEQNPDYASALKDLENPIRVLAGALRLAFAQQQLAVQQALATVREEFRERIRLREQLLSVLNHLPPDEAVLFRYDCARFDVLELDRPSLKQLRRRHPLLFKGANDNTLSQQRRRARKRWAELLAQAEEETPAPWNGHTIVEILSNLQKED